MRTSETVLRLRAVSRTFNKRVEALTPVDLDVVAGSFLAVLGPSGCGKSTLLRLIAGLDRATTGTVDTSITDRSHISYVFQDPTLLPWRTVLRNVCLPLELRGNSSVRSHAVARDALKQVGLADAAERYPAQLSGGMRMRVSLARALATDPTLLLLDEPFAALDEITRQHLDDQLRALWRRRPMTVIFVTHSTTEATYLADRAIVFSSRPGRIVFDTPIDLPPDRSASIRSDPAFARQTRALYDALDGGGA